MLDATARTPESIRLDEHRYQVTNRRHSSGAAILLLQDRIVGTWAIRTNTGLHLGSASTRLAALDQVDALRGVAA